MREIAEPCIDIHLAVGVEARWMQTDPTLEVPVKPDPRCARVPPIAVDILEGVAVSGSLDEAARLVRDGIVPRVGERTERIVADVDARSVDVVLGARRGV